MASLSTDQDIDMSAGQRSQQAAAPANNNNNDNDDNKDDSPPKMDVSLSLKGVSEFNQFPFNKSSNKFLFMAGVKAPFFRPKDRAAIDLCCVVDESSSMGGDRIKLVKETLTFIIEHLEENDRFAIVGYHSFSRVLLELVKMDKDGKKNALTKVKELKPQGCTALCAGLVDGIQLMRKRDANTSNPVSSIMLFTDGEANEGYTRAEDICRAMRNPDFANSFGKSKPMQQQQRINPFGFPMQQQQQQQQQQQRQMQQPMMQQAPQIQGFVQQTIPQPMQQQQQIPRAQGQPPMQALQRPTVPVQPPPQLQGQAQSQAQGVPPPAPPAPRNNNNNNNNNDNDEKNREVGTDNNDDNNDNDLPCTVNTFGFGGNHNASLLEKIAENGRGMYVFIENKDMIAESFAECLGGLVSIIGKNLELKVTPLNGVKISQCLSRGYNITKNHKANNNNNNNNSNNNDVSNEVESYMIKIHDIQSEEERDLIFELTLPQLSELRNEWPYMQLSCKYENIVKKTDDGKNKHELLNIICNLSRNDKDEMGERSDELDSQYNRILAANAMENADKLAAGGQLNDARNLLNKTSESIKSSKTGKSKYASNLVSDMNRCVNNLSNQQQYKSHGTKMLRMNMQSHQQQRSVQSMGWGAQQAYMNCSKASYVSRSKKK